jgi:flagellar biosynthesis anti-sigma factor FlgM
MRIDDLNRTPLTQTQGAEKTDQAAEHGAQEQTSVTGGADQAEVSQLAQALGARDASRVEQLRMQVASGNYEVPAQALASSIVNAHLKE